MTNEKDNSVTRTLKISKEEMCTAVAYWLNLTQMQHSVKVCDVRSADVDDYWYEIVFEVGQTPKADPTPREMVEAMHAAKDAGRAQWPEKFTIDNDNVEVHGDLAERIGPAPEQTP